MGRRPNNYSSSYAFYAPGALQYVSWYDNSGFSFGNYQVTHYDGLYDETGASANYANDSQYSGTITRQYSTDVGGIINHYDAVGRLLSDVSTANGGYNYTFNYDGASNPTGFKNNTVQYNADNQFQNSVTYDGNGFPTSYFGNSISADDESRMASWGSSWTAGYRADGLRAYKSTQSQLAPPPTVISSRLRRHSDASTAPVGRPMRKASKRRSKQAIAGLTYYYYDGGIPVLETNSAGTVTAYNVFGPLGLIARVVSGTPTYYQFDSEGNVAVRSNNASPTPAVTSYSTYDAYGTESDSVQNLTDPFGYKGQFGYYYDRENKLNLCGFRYYDPAHGRWLNRDPVGYAGGTNLYGYCEGNPVGSYDASGAGPAADIMALLRMQGGGAAHSGCSDDDPMASLAKMGGLFAGIALATAAGVQSGTESAAVGGAIATAGGVGAHYVPTPPQAAQPTITAPPPQVTLNRIQGTAAEGILCQQYERAGYEVAMHPGRVNTPFGPRYPDLGIKRNGKLLMYVEVKSGGARRTASQRLKDWWIEYIQGVPVVVHTIP